MSPEKSIANISSCQDIIQCAFNLNEFEIEVYKSVLKAGLVRADELADKMSRDRSTVYRALQKLITCGMCFRETKNLEKGGYYHVYGAIDRETLKKRLEVCVEDWPSRMKRALAKFDDNI